MSYIPDHDLHNHTIHCTHACNDATIQNLIKSARELGLGCLGLSEHVIFPEENVWVERVRSDLKELDTTGNLPLVLLGTELDPDPVSMDGRYVIDIPDLDYVILSIHRLPVSGIAVWRFFEMNYSTGEIERIGRLWLEWLEACIEYSSFDILGHPVRFPIELGLFDLKDDRFFQQVYAILMRLAAKKAAFEINNSLARTLIKRGYIDIYADLIRELKKSGVKFSRGSDSHSASNVGEWNEAQILVNLSGLTETDWIRPEKFKHEKS